MPWRLSPTPARRRGVEILDDPRTPPDVRARSMEDIGRANALFGGKRAATRALRGVLAALPREAVLLDVGTGLGDIPAAAVTQARDSGVALSVVVVDIVESLVRAATPRVGAGAVADVSTLPFADDSVDVVTCSQLLHHFTDADARHVIGELHRVSRGWVVVSDLQRSWIAAGGFWIASRGLRFHSVTRRDGVASVLRGFTDGELSSLVLSATGVAPVVRHAAFWRLSAVWSKRPVRR